MSAPRRRVLYALVTALTLALACAVPMMPAPVPSPLPPGGINTIVVMTAGAAQTQTAVALPPAFLSPSPTFTATATKIPPTDTPTPTETVLFHFVIPTFTKAATASAGSDSATATYSCKLVSQTPANGTKVAPGTAFDVTWKVKNTGNKVWDAASTDFVFKSGTNMSAINGYDLPGNVPVNGTITLTVPMTSPGANGTYTSTWTVRRGKIDICTVSIKITVK